MGFFTRLLLVRVDREGGFTSRTAFLLGWVPFVALERFSSGHLSALTYHMWPFKAKKPPEDTSERITLIEKRMLRMEEEWTEVYHKFRVLQMRVAKQAQRLEQAPEGEATAPGESDLSVVPGTSLSARQQAINNSILARRNRLAVQKGGS